MNEMSYGPGATSIDALVSQMKRMQREVSTLPKLRWATVTAVDPLRIRLDGDTLPLLGTPDTIAGGLNVSDRVQVAIQNGRAIVQGRGGGVGTHPEHYHGPAAGRFAITPRYFDKYFSTDGDRISWVGNRTGGWRRYGGVATVPAGSWSTSGTWGAGRTVSWNLWTIIDEYESIDFSVTGTGSGFGIASIASVTRHADRTALSFRHMQLGSTATNAFRFTWHVVPASDHA